MSHVIRDSQGEPVVVQRFQALADRTLHHPAHCHWTYEHGRYRSPWFWPTRADAEHASRAFPTPGTDGGPRVFAVHAAHCTCADKEEKA